MFNAPLRNQTPLDVSERNSAHSTHIRSLALEALNAADRYEQLWEYFSRAAQRTQSPAAFRAHAGGRLYDWLAATPTFSKWGTFSMGAQSEATFLLAIPRLVSPLERLLNQIQSLAHLEDDWDGYGACAPNQVAIEEAMFAAEALQQWSTKLLVTLDGRGEVTLLGRKPGTYLDLGFTGNGTYSFFGIDSEGRRRYGDERQLAHIAQDADLTAILSA